MRVPFTNDGDRNVFISGKLIPPGETREVNANDVPGRSRPAPEAPQVEPEGFDAEALLEGTVNDVADHLGELTDDELDAVELAEQSGKERRGVLSAVAEERMRRAGAGDDAPDGSGDGDQQEEAPDG